MIPTDAIEIDDTLSPSEVFLLPILLYSVWQVAYLFFTEVLLFQMMENDPELVTSMRLVLNVKRGIVHINGNIKYFNDAGILQLTRRMGCTFS